jgi:lysyl-tRNA synthetase class 2
MLDDLIKERIKKRDALIAAGIEVYPASVSRSHTIGESLEQFEDFFNSKKEISVVGRIMGMRGHGGVVFYDLRDGSGQLQVVFKKDTGENFDLLRENLDIGDFISATGTLFTTQRGEKSLEALRVKVITKTLRPLPSEHFGLNDVETRLRDRYLDILFDPKVKEIFQKKAIFWNEFRKNLVKEGFLEVETPVLENLPGGADAEPFITHHNALDIDLYLRISLELPQKKILVGGFEKVFELGRIFRNEGVSAEHLQDYTQLEFYWAYADYKDLMKFVEKLYKKVIKAATGGLKTNFEGKEINWDSKWPKLEYFKLFKEMVGLDLKKTDVEKLRAEAERRGLKPEPGLGRGRLIDLLFKKVVRPNLIQPAFLINPPADIEPLAKRSLKDAGKVERFQIVAGGTELGKGFSEGNDPADQRARFEEQMNLRAAGDKEAQRLDEDFLRALEYGMPPAAGFGTSERLFAILMDRPVRETVIFPLMRPK